MLLIDSSIAACLPADLSELLAQMGAGETSSVRSSVKENIMKKALYVALGASAVYMVTWAIVHRRVIAAMVKGEPLPEPPAWHKGHPCAK